MSQRFSIESAMTRENELNGVGGRGLFQNLLVSPIAKVYSPSASIHLKLMFIYFSSVYLVSKHPKLSLYQLSS